MRNRLDGDELLNSKDEKENNILHLAIASKQLQIIKLLLRNPLVDINSINLKESPPLDMLLESPREHGALAVGEMIWARGGKTAAECTGQSPAQSEPNPRVHPNTSSRRILNEADHFWH